MLFWRVLHTVYPLYYYYSLQVNVGRDVSDLSYFSFCISSYCVSALNGSRNKEVVDQATHLPHLLTEGGGRASCDMNQMQPWLEYNDLATHILSLSCHVSLFLNKVISRDYRVQDNRRLIHKGSECFYRRTYLGSWSSVHLTVTVVVLKDNKIRVQIVE